MKRPLHGLAGWLALGLLLGLTSSPARADERPRSNPSFKAVDRLLAEHIERKQIAGAVALVIQDGRLVYSTAVGMRDREAGAAMTPDTIFRIASMTKPVTSVAVMMLRDEGKLALDDPLSKYLPEFANPQVMTVDGEGRHRTVPGRREITIRDLLTHTSGLAYGFGAPPPLAERYAQLGITDGLVETQLTTAENARRLAQAPLPNHPGEAWQYGLSTDILGRVVEVVSGKALDEFFRERIFTPLGMKDTHFRLPQEKLPRLAALYRPGDDGMIERVGKGRQRHGGVTYSATYPYSDIGTYLSGGAGLVSTAADYARFLQMLLRDGELDGVRLLKSATVAEMTRNQIGDLNILFTIHGDKFGLGIGVHTDDSKDRNGASVGTYSWGGIFHTYFWVDPQQEVVGVLMTQLYPFDHLSLWGDFQQTVYAALGERSEQHGGRGPQPGEVYREYAVHNGGNRDWRVTDPQARAPGAHEFLPNPVLELEIGDLQHAVRAEALLDRWGGHLRTTDKRIRFNGNAWLRVPELTTTPGGRAEYYYSQDNPVLDVPLPEGRYQHVRSNVLGAGE